MIFLPVVERELRVASRKRSTFWIRIAAALVALIIGTGILVMVSTGSGFFRPPAMGQILFKILTWLGLAAALFAGFFFTSDCLSEEKREGTLGFLFLTDLRGYDVVLGKLLATSLRSFYTLFSVLPVLGITLLMGGETGAEFWKTSLALMNALFLSLAAGMFVSSISRDPQKAMGATLFLLVLLSALGPITDAVLSKTSFRPDASVSSPVYLFVTAGWNGRSPFWPALLANHLISWILLALSCVLLPRTWQQKATKSSMAAAGWARWWKYGSAKRRMRLRAKLMGINPVWWLACRERWQSLSFWVIAIMAVGALVGLLFAKQPFVWMVWSYLAGALSLMLYLGVAAQSNRFFVEAQRSGLIELMLGTPLTVKDIVRGHWRAMLRLFAIPLGVCLAVQLVGTTVAQVNTFKQFAAVTAAAGGTTTNNATTAFTNVTTGSSSTTVQVRSTANIVPFSLSSLSSFDEVLLPIISAAMTTLTTFANLTALCWFGMWMGMTSKNSNLATLKTIAFVQIMPWFVISFASGITTMLLMMPRFLGGGTSVSFSFDWYQLLSVAVTTTLCLLKDAAFLVWARKKLFSDFRTHSTRTILPIHPQRPPVLAPPLPGVPAGSAPP